MEHARPVMRTIIGVSALGFALTLGGELIAQGPPPPERGGMADMAPVAPLPIARLTSGEGAVAARGRVAEVFGTAFILDDGSGRALIETGRRGEERTTVAPGTTVTAQGRFDHGVLRAAMLTDASGNVTRLGHGRAPWGGPRCGRDAPGAPPQQPAG